jgi:hypothetical protein
MPATSALRLSLSRASPAPTPRDFHCSEGKKIPGATSAARLPCRCTDRFFGAAWQGITTRRKDCLSYLMLPFPAKETPVSPFSDTWKSFTKMTFFLLDNTMPFPSN